MIKTDQTSESTLWDKAAEAVLEQERKERNDPDWKPTLLNGSLEFNVRVHELMKEWVENEIEEPVK